MIDLEKGDKQMIWLALRCFYEVYGSSIDIERINKLIKKFEGD